MKSVLYLMTAVMLGASVGCAAVEKSPSDAGTPGEDGSIDAAMRGDVGGSDVTLSDQGQLSDGGCSGACATTAAIVTIDPREVTFSRAVFGLTPPAETESGAWEIHVEAYIGGEEGCPTQSSPTPSHTLIVTNIPVEPIPATYAREEGLAVSVLDFEGTLVRDGIVATALTASVDLTFGDICTECAGENEAGVVAMDVDALLEGGGTVRGHVYATHCSSLDF